MVLLQTIALAMSLTGAQDTVLLDFYSDSCPPCRAMAPVISQLEAAGYPVIKVNITQHPAYARQWGVSAVPTFIMVDKGRNVGRITGMTTQQQLLALYRKANVHPGQQEQIAQAEPSPGQAAPSQQHGIEVQPPRMPNEYAASEQPRDTPLAPVASAPASKGRAEAVRRAMAASVRIKIMEDGGFSFGTGTIVDVKGEEALVLTCGHIFRDGGKDAKVEIDLFENGRLAGTVPGQVIHYDLNNDVGMIAIRPGRKIEPMKIAGRGHRDSVGSWCFTVGCDRGALPSVRESRVTAINKYNGPANIETSGAPVVGRSGGGLFTADGTLIGVCNAADPQDDEGLYAAIGTIHQELLTAKLDFIIDRGDNSLSGQGETRLADSQPPVTRTPTPTESRGTGEDLRDALTSMGDDAELICIIRNRNDPKVPSRTVVISKPSRQLMQMIAARDQGDQGPTPTAMHVSESDKVSANKQEVGADFARSAIFSGVQR